MSNVFLNGSYLSLEEAKVPLEDRGLLFGDGVYEVVRVYNNRPFLLLEHLHRLEKSAAHLLLNVPYTTGELEQIALKLLQKSEIQNGILYLQLTRGAAPRTHEFPQNASSTFFILAREKSFDPRTQQAGVSTLIFPDDRWDNCHIKSLNLLPNVLAKEKAVRKGAYEAFFLRQGIGMTEGGSSNIFAVFEGQLVTAPEGNYILSGITRAQVLKLAQESEIPVVERYLQKSELLQAEEVFITSTTDEIAPVVEIDGQLIGRGHPGPVTQSLQEKFYHLLPS